MGTTTKWALPYPEPTDPVAAGADNIKALANAIDSRPVATAAGAATTDSQGWLTVPASAFGLATITAGIVNVWNNDSSGRTDETVWASLVQPGSGGAVPIARISKIFATPGVGWGVVPSYSVQYSALAW